MSADVLALVAPYGCCEATDAALAVAAFGERSGVSVRYYSGTSSASEVHPYWDARVIRIPWPDAPCVDESSRVWFFDRPHNTATYVGEALFSELQSVPFPEACSSFAKLDGVSYAKILCDSQSVMAAVKQYGASRKFLVVPWCSEPPAQPVSARPMTQSILCLANVAMMRSAGFSLLADIEKFLTACPDAKVTLAAMVSTLMASLENAAETLECTTRGRFQLVTRAAGLARRQLYQDCDLVWLAMKPPCSHMVLFEAIEHLRPVALCQDLCYHKLVRSDVNGLVLASAGWADSMIQLFRRPTWSRLAIDQPAWQATKLRRERFERAWQQLFSDLNLACVG